MTNKSGGNVCPKCGTKLGQKNIFPICGGAEQKKDHAGGNGANPSSLDYVSRVIDFVEKHPDDWDDEFIAFFEQQQQENDSVNYKSCLEACTRIHELLKSLPESGRIPGTRTLEIMNGIRDVFPGISEDNALEIVIGMSKRRTEDRPRAVARIRRAMRCPNGVALCGCIVERGLAKVGARVKVYRGKKLLFDGRAITLYSDKKYSLVAEPGMICSVRLDGFADLTTGDVIQFYEV